MRSLNRLSRIYINFSLVILLYCYSGCKRLVEVDGPYTSTNATNVYTTDLTAAAALTGIYSNLSSLSVGGVGLLSTSFYAGLSADEFTLFNGSTSPVILNCYRNDLSSTSNQSTVDIWSYIYPLIFYTNSAIEGLNSSSNLTPAVKLQLLGEAKFMRAFFYFYLANFYGDVPLILSTDYKTTAIVPRTSKANVYSQIILDLKDAQSELSANYVDGTALSATTERTRPNKWVATALLARVYLYAGDYPDAETQASAIINNTALYSLPSLTNAFLKNSQEAIWQLQPINSGFNTNDARLFVIPSTGPSSATPIYLSNALLNSFEFNDQRRIYWVDSVIVSGVTYFFPYKYKSNTLNAAVTNTTKNMTEYEMVFRLGEQYLIRAEARNEQGESSAISDLNAVRARALLGNYSGGTDRTSVARAIMHERQVELFSEWGHRWFDIIRRGAADSIMGGHSGACQAKGGNWSSNWELFPIVQHELQLNPELVQNPGY